MITIGQLIEKLKKFDPSLPVLLARDEEGNGYAPLADEDLCVSRFELDDYGIEIGLAELTEELEEFGFSEEDVIDGPECLVLWPGWVDEELIKLSGKLQ